MKVWRYALLASAAAIVACDSSTEPDDFTVSVRFDVEDPATGDVGVLEGTNGTLEITDIRMLADEFKMARQVGACDGALVTDDCQDLDLSPRFVGFPLSSGSTDEIRKAVLPGSYLNLSFETQAATDDGMQVPDALLEEIRDDFPDWPMEASAVVTGAFTPASGDDAVSFVVYIDVDERVDLDFSSPLVVSDEEDERTVTVTLDLTMWFANEDGTVVDLSEFDFEGAGVLLDLASRFGSGFTQVAIED